MNLLKGGASMKPYKNVNAIPLQILLEATPFSTFPEKNFSKHLTESTFFQKLYVNSNSDEHDTEIKTFNNAISNCIMEFGNEHARVSMIHIKGYGGCGKTTFAHYLMRRIQNQNKVKIECIDYERADNAESRVLDWIVDYLRRRASGFSRINEYLYSVSRREVYKLSRFDKVSDTLLNLSNSFRDMFLGSNGLWQSKISEDILRSCFEKNKKETYSNADAYLYFLYFLMLLLMIYDRFQGKRISSKPVVMLIDNVDSMEPIEEEMRLLPKLRDFVDHSATFVSSNLDNEKSYNELPISRVFDKTKFVFILTTRVITAQRYADQLARRGNEDSLQTVALTLPSEYYDNNEIIQRKIAYYRGLEEDLNQPKMKSLETIGHFASLFYNDSVFKRLFNGNIRRCESLLCHLEGDEEAKEVFTVIENKIVNIHHGDASGISRHAIRGMLLNIILKYFKEVDIFQKKLHLSECCKDGGVSCSRLALTILREKNGTASMMELFERLTPMFSANDVSTCITDMSEEGRNVWRRLVVFNKIFKDSEDDLALQAEVYLNGERNESKFSKVSLCDAGRTYIEYVVPHFEFMFSRHDNSTEFNLKNRPLFADYSIRKKFEHYYFENTIEAVYKNVEDCCYNCHQFALSVKREKGITLEEYANSVYNYRSVGRDGVLKEKQSYESRMIFNHIRYIEEFRAYLLDIYKDEKDHVKQDISEQLIKWIKKYLELYTGLEKYRKSGDQDKAAKVLLDIANRIKDGNYADYTTVIEV